MMDHQDWVESFESEADRESYDRWLQEIEADEAYRDREVTKMVGEEF
jgi:hypothetical protein